MSRHFQGGKNVKKIDFEAHFYSDEYVEAMYKNVGYPRFADDAQSKGRRLWYNSGVGQPFADALLHQLLDMGEKRLQKMDECGIDVQALSLSAPGIEQFDPATGTALARKTNDLLFDVTRRYPGRFMGYAALAPKNPKAAVDELERAVTELGFKGWNTHSNYGETFLYDRSYWPILQRAEKLGVPVYIHPTVSASPMMQGYGFALAGTPLGFGVDATQCMLGLIYGGIFDQCPKLTVILGHLGETLPYFFSRLDSAFMRQIDPEARPKIEKKPSEYFQNNVFITTSGNYYQPAFMCAYETMGKDRILLGTDYPYEDIEECMEFLERLPIQKEDKDRIYGLNAKRLGFTA
jgi:predicted TIM-barrel fold metal-dependent hydrolase